MAQGERKHMATQRRADSELVSIVSQQRPRALQTPSCRWPSRLSFGPHLNPACLNSAVALYRYRFIGAFRDSVFGPHLYTSCLNSAATLCSYRFIGAFCASVLDPTCIHLVSTAPSRSVDTDLSVLLVSRFWTPLVNILSQQRRHALYIPIYRCFLCLGVSTTHATASARSARRL